MSEQIKQFKNKNNIEIIEKLMKINNGYITSKQLTELGIHRMYLNIMCERKIIERVARGIYINIEKIKDLYYVFSLCVPNAVFSHMTALYFHGLSIKAPTNKYDITVCNNYYNYKLKYHNVFYVSKQIYNLGLTEVKTPMGNIVKAYDIERCICDIIRSKNRMDIEHIKHSVKEYINGKDKNLVKLSEYAEKMGVLEDVMEFVSICYE